MQGVHFDLHGAVTFMGLLSYSTAVEAASSAAHGTKLLTDQVSIILYSSGFGSS